MLGDRIKEIRTAEGFTQETFARQFKLSKSHISKIEAGKANPSPLVVASICNFFGINEEWLQTGKGEKWNDISASTAPKAKSPEKTTAFYAYKYYHIACMLEKTCNLDRVWNGHYLKRSSEIVLNFILAKIILYEQGKIKSEDLLTSLGTGFHDEFYNYFIAWDTPTAEERRNKIDIQAHSLFVSDLERYSLCTLSDVPDEEKKEYEAALLEHRFYSS